MRSTTPIAATILAVLAIPATAGAAAPSFEYDRCAAAGDATVVEVSAAPCAEAEAVAAQVAARPTAEAGAALQAAGWTPLRAQATDDETAYDLVAVRGGAALRLHRPGGAPDLDGWEAGRELVLARPKLVAGGKVPKGAVSCTSSWLVRLPGGALGGLTAGHCGGLRKDRTVQRRYVALRRPPQPGIVLGRVKQILKRTKPLDALVAPVPVGLNRTTLPVIDRGVSRPPWIVTGVDAPVARAPVCFSGRTSGIDQCGNISGPRARTAEIFLSALAGTIVRCTTIRAAPGDSGGPVYSEPDAQGRVKAVGITTLIVVDSKLMCFTPLDRVLKGLGARLVAATT